MSSSADGVRLDGCREPKGHHTQTEDLASRIFVETLKYATAARGTSVTAPGVVQEQENTQ